ncbi:Ser/Thr protein kinase RdoA (MazF antagonist) [Deinobacterium chartae]|uniref:Ser/Thr protein kinase RdoA (MazF antagonist) n=1 Tax=Deinobacterium chartae TaxID=521158 RepID=A0A841I163_9DEIO|nr:phosphotransferase [Deinobacterium chartae]MBB6098170.1 Ser/Thr protein kinase RdoA (MazF antagonist) [Deinobacterium chartae]
MLPETAARYQESVRDEAVRRFNLENLQPLNAFESFVFAAEQGGVPCILKITDTLRRRPEQILGELEFCDYLARGGLNVPRPLRSLEERSLEVIDVPGQAPFLAYLTTRAPGRHLRAADITPELLETYGRTVARMHALSETYTPSRPEYVRQQWHQDRHLQFERSLTRASEAARQHAQGALSRLRVLPAPRRGLGLIHSDLHAGNLHIDGDRLHVFDFDDLEYNHFVYDLAVVLYYAFYLHDPARESREAFGARFLEGLLAGYRRERRLNPEDLAPLRDMLILRDAVMLGVLFDNWDLAQISASERAYLEEVHARLEAGVPVFEPNVSVLA